MARVDSFTVTLRGSTVSWLSLCLSLLASKQLLANIAGTTPGFCKEWTLANLQHWLVIVPILVLSCSFLNFLNKHFSFWTSGSVNAKMGIKRLWGRRKGAKEQQALDDIEVRKSLATYTARLLLLSSYRDAWKRVQGPGIKWVGLTKSEASCWYSERF